MLRTLSKEQHRALRRFAQSKYFCSNASARNVLVYLSRHVSSGRSIPSSPEAILADLGLEPLNPLAYFDKLQPLMVHVVEDFLAISRLRNDQSTWQTQRDMALAVHRATTVSSSGRQRKTVGSGETSLTESIETLDTTFLAERLRFATHALNTKHILNREVTTNGIPELIAFATATGAMADEKVKLYVDLLNLVESGNKKLWKELVKQLPYIKRALIPQSAHDVFVLLLNIAIRYSNEGSRKEYVMLAKKLDELNALASEGRIEHLVFVNTVVVALQEAEFAWADDFIKRYKRKLSGERAAEVYAEVMAMWYFYRYWKLGEVESLDRSHRALVEAGDLMHEDVFETYSARKLQTMIYLERQDYGAARSLVETTIRLLNYNKDQVKSKHDATMPFFRMVRRYVDLPFSNADLASRMAKTILDELRDEPRFGSKDWLEEKLHAVIGGSALSVVA